MRTILLIDDYVPNLSTLSLILKSSGYRTLEAENAEQAERKFRDNAVDVVLVDHGLPGMNGSEVARHLKLIRNVLVVMLTGNPELKATPEAVDLLLTKPQEIPALLEKLERLIAAQAPA
jgi:two-component system response regulator ResD